jgi:hypothetical protein
MATRRRTLVIAAVLVGAIGLPLYWWSTSAYSADLAQAREVIRRVEADGVVKKYGCNPNRVELARSAWDSLPSDRLRRNLAMAFARVCIADSDSGPRMQIVDAVSGRTLAIFDGRTLEQ